MNIKDIRFLIVGCGNWGVNHVKTLKEITDNFLVYDLVDSAHIGRVGVPLERCIPSSHSIKNEDFDAVIIATTSSTHFSLTKQFLLAGKHVLVEKPVVTSQPELDELVRVSHGSKGILMAGHTLLYSKAYERIKQAVEGKPVSMISRRMKHNPIKGDDEIYRLLPHDLALLDYYGFIKHGTTCILEGNTFKLGNLDGTTANIVVSWDQDPPIRDFYILGPNGDTRYFNDSNETMLFNHQVIDYDKEKSLYSEQMAFCRAILGEDTNRTGITHIQKVYSILTSIKEWKPLE